MVFILGKNFHNNSKVICMLKTFYGLGDHMSNLILNDLNITKNCRIKDLSQPILIKIPKWLEKFKIDLEVILSSNNLILFVVIKSLCIL